MPVASAGQHSAGLEGSRLLREALVAAAALAVVALVAAFH